MAAKTLTLRELNRATLARQMLLERADATPLTAIQRLAGMQAQAPLSPYVGLWTRLGRFEAGQLADLVRRRAVVRASLMRMTIHLVSARDALAWRPVLQPMAEGGWRGSQWSKQIGSARPADVLAAASELMERAGDGIGRTRLGQLLAERFPDADPFSLGGTVAYLMPIAQPTPRGVWGEGGAAKLTSLTSWLGRPLDPEPSVDQLVLRCIAALGPMTVMDVQAWSRLTRLREVVDRLGPRLRAFRGDDGAELFDLPRAPRPHPDSPAPARYLPEYDNLLLSHADRRRVNPSGRSIPLFPGNGAQLGTFLLDGQHAGHWRIHRPGRSPRSTRSPRHTQSPEAPAQLQLEPFAKLARHDVEELTAEGLALLGFAAPDADEHDVRVLATI